MTDRTDRTIITLLCAWFHTAARDLPWRGERRTGYTALVSEAMLQQTQVARVLDQYPAFMARFPDVASLAEASEHDVLECWQGMGYYRRARLLHQAAQKIVREFGSEVPGDVAALRTLPGVGRYTAGAIASIAFGAHEPIVDGNVHRVLARLFAHRAISDDRTATETWTWKTAERLVKRAARPGVFNEAMMELGATVCVPRNPKCDTCPLRTMCKAHKLGAQHEIPEPKQRAKRQSAFHHAVVILREGKGARAGCAARVLLEQRPAQGMWAGMWQVPTLESANALTSSALQSSLESTRSLRVLAVTHCGDFAHATTHRQITFQVFTATTRARRGHWIELGSKTLQRLPMSSAQRRVLQLAEELR